MPNREEASKAFTYLFAREPGHQHVWMVLSFRVVFEFRAVGATWEASPIQKGQ